MTTRQDLYDVHWLMRRYYQNHVVMPRTEQQRLASARDKNVARVESGLMKLQADGVRLVGPLVDSIDMGSYAMSSLILSEHDDYDIDVGLVVDADCIPADPYQARNRVTQAIKAGAGDRFAREPETRPNASTVWYAGGYHVDFVVYRRHLDVWGVPSYEQAGPNWRAADPRETVGWFRERASVWAEVPGRVVENRQFQRMVRLLKQYCKARPRVSLPGGFILSALLAEVYRIEPDGDDLAFYNCLTALLARLKLTCEVYNPARGDEKLTNSSKRLNQVERLKAEIKKSLGDLKVLLEKDCTVEKARAAWGKALQHSYWASVARTKSNNVPPDVGEGTVTMNLYEKDPERWVGSLEKNHQPIEKWMLVRFDVDVPAGARIATVEWRVRNFGDEAADMGDLESVSRETEPYHSRGTSYEGRHAMTVTCFGSLGELIARSTVWVRIGT